MSDLHEKLQKQLCTVFLKALYSGSREPLEQYRAHLTLEIKNFNPPKKIINQTALDEIISTPELNMSDAQTILAQARQSTTTLSASPHQNPQKDSIIKILKSARTTAEKLNLDYRGYTVKENARYIGKMSLAHAFLFAAFPLILDIADKFQTTSIDHYATAILTGAVIGAVRGALINNKDYLNASTRGLKFITKSFKPSW
jgi:hypothetical protein